MAENGARDEGARSSRQRSADTRRRRSRTALLAAAEIRFREHGWQRTRMEDVAHDAGTSLTTVYNHFPTKHALIGALYAPVFAPCLERAIADLTTGPDPWDAVARHLDDAAEILHREFALTKPFLEAVWDALVRFGVGHTPPGDPRLLVPLPAALLQLIEYGQRRATFRLDVTAFDVAAYVMNSLALQVFCFPDASPDASSRLARQTCEGILTVR